MSFTIFTCVSTEICSTEEQQRMESHLSRPRWQPSGIYAPSMVCLKVYPDDSGRVVGKPYLTGLRKVCPLLGSNRSDIVRKASRPRCVREDSGISLRNSALSQYNRGQLLGSGFVPHRLWMFDLAARSLGIIWPPQVEDD